MKEENEIKKEVKKRYGQFAEEGSSCCPDYSCCDIGYSIDEIKDLPTDISEFSLGCGNPVALASISEGEIILDIGSGGGLDAFLASKKVGPKGKVIGLDITEQMVKRAKQNARKGNYNNIEFKLGEAEDIPVKDNSIDLVMSNCVINLAPDKEKVYREIYRVLKPGGRFVISDLVTEKELDESIKNNPEKLVACVGGALTEKDYIGAIKKAGFRKVEILKKSFMVVSGIKMLSETIQGEKKAIVMPDQKTVKIFTVPLQFPCGPDVACCGPIGQSDDDVKKLSDAIRNLGVAVEVHNIMEDGFAGRFPSVANLLGSFGPGIVPILAIGDEVISMGTPTPEEAVQAIKEKL